MNVQTPTIIDHWTAYADGTHDHYEVPEFSNDEAQYCPLTYSFSYDPANTWLLPEDSKVEKFGRFMHWEPNDNSFAGDHIISIVATGPAPDFMVFSVSYTITVVPVCFDKSITPPVVED